MVGISTTNPKAHSTFHVMEAPFDPIGLFSRVTELEEQLWTYRAGLSVVHRQPENLLTGDGRDPRTVGDSREDTLVGRQRTLVSPRSRGH
jgi:hypothetical protein